MRPTTPAAKSRHSPTDDDEADIGSRQKKIISLLCAGTLLLALLSFSVALRFEQPLLSLFVAPNLSVYLALMLALTLLFWGLTWLYVILIDRLDRRSQGDRT
ncbi:UNVERIFIED_ORG: uncharacterized membrane protein (DUF485 family) [Paraburkholderia sediminicola]|nr:uncharacterized membrane protein (DUF485 family) [Paraburkholderia sediminicola]